MRKIFISYARSDYDKALELYTFLKNRGFSPWLDKKDLLPGQEWKAEIKQAIRESVVFIACLSNSSVNKQGFVQVELKDGLDVAEEMPEGVIYIIPVRLDECDVPSRLEKYQWMDYFEPDELEKLIRAIQFRVKPDEISKLEQEKYFDAGERVKAVRNELSINTSQFVELLDFTSQREYEAMENRVKEFPLSLLKKVSDASGARLDWLKHGEKPRYEVKTLSLVRVQRDLDYCTSLSPQEYFFTLNKKSLHAGLVVQTTEYSYQVFSFNMELNFWDWIDDHWAIPAFYHFLKALSNSWGYVFGLILPPQTDRELFNGETHFLVASKNAKHLGGSLLYDLLDLEEGMGNHVTYSERYGGKWMQRIHEEIKKYLHL